MTTLQEIADDLIARAEWTKRQPRMSDNDEFNDILLNQAWEEAQEMFEYLNR